MTHRLTTNCAKNYCNRTLIVKVIEENVVTCFLGHGVEVWGALHKLLSGVLGGTPKENGFGEI